MNNGNYDLHRFLTAVREQQVELAYDLERAKQRVADIERLIAEARTAEENILREIKETIE